MMNPVLAIMDDARKLELSQTDLCLKFVDVSRYDLQYIVKTDTQIVGWCRGVLVV